MNRRDFVSGTVLTIAWPTAVRAQDSRKRHVIGFLNGASYELSAHLVKAFHQGLDEMGYVEGRRRV
jgi:hypothetical protein